MNIDQFIENIRQEIREEGFLCQSVLLDRVYVLAKECELEVGHGILEKILCNDIKAIEYKVSVRPDTRILYYHSV